MQKTVNRSSLVDVIYREIGLSNAESANLVDILFDEIIEGFLRDGVVKISSFGSFYLRKKNSRIGRNPKTKKEALIESRNSISFYASNILKAKLNS